MSTPYAMNFWIDYATAINLYYENIVMSDNNFSYSAIVSTTTSNQFSEILQHLKTIGGLHKASEIVLNYISN